MSSYCSVLHFSLRLWLRRSHPIRASLTLWNSWKPRIRGLIFLLHRRIFHKMERSWRFHTWWAGLSLMWAVASWVTSSSTDVRIHTQRHWSSSGPCQSKHTRVSDFSRSSSFRVYRRVRTWWQAASTDRGGQRWRTASDSRNLQGLGFSWLCSSTWNSSLGGSELSSRGRALNMRPWSSAVWWEFVRWRSWNAREMWDCKAGLNPEARDLTWTNPTNIYKNKSFS